MNNLAVKEDGFTLMEVLIAVFLLAVGLMSVSSMQTVAISGNKFAKDTSIMVKLAEEMVDRVRVNGVGDLDDLKSYNNMSTQVGCDSLVDPAKGDCNQWKARLEGTDFGVLRSRGDVTVQLNTPIEYTATVRVRLFWGSSTMMGSSRSITLNTVINTWGL